MKQNKIPRNEYIRKPVGKTNPYKEDTIYTDMGQWKYPGQVTKIPSGDITMQGVPYPVYGEDNLGYSQMMYPGMDYTFPGQYVTEYPMAQDGREINSLEADLITKVLMNRNRDKDFIQRAYALGQNPGMFSLPDPDQFGSRMSHKMGWGEDDQGQAYMFPTVMNPGNENIKVPNQYADYISSIGYKKEAGIPYQAYGGDPSLPNITGHYKTGGWLDQYQTRGEVKPKMWTREDVFKNTGSYEGWDTFIKKYPGAIGINPYKVDKNDQHLPVYPTPKNKKPKEVITPDYLPMIQTGMPDMISREPEIIASPTPRPSSTNNRISWRMDPETRKMIPVYLEGKTQKVKEGKRLYNKNIPSSTAAIPADFVPQFEPDGNKDVVSKQMGGWLDAYDDEYRRGGQRRRRGTSKNIESSINDIFRRNYDVFGPAGKSRFNPRARYEEGGWLDKYQDAGQLRAASTTAAVPVSTQAPINPVNPESNMGIVDFVKHRWNTRDQGPSDWNLLMMDKTGSYVDSGVTPFDLMLAAPQQVIKTATKAAKNLPIEKAAKKVLGDRAVNQIKTDVKTVSDNVKESIKQYKKIKQYNKTYSQELKDLPDLYKQALQDLNTPEGVRRLKELGVDNMDDFMKFAESASKKGTPLATTGYGPSFDNAGKKITEPFVNINFEQIDELRKKIPLLKTKSAIDHEYGHLITDYLRSKGKTYKGVTDLDIEAVEKLTPHVTSNITDMLKKVQFKTPKKSVIKNITTPSDTELPYYFFKGSKGEEPLAHLRETKRNMLDAGIIDNIHQTITPELLKMFRAATGRKDRMLSFLQNTPEAYKTLASLLNKTPALIPIGLGVGAAANQKKMGGWLDKYNNF